MAVTIESTTDSAEAVRAATGELTSKESQGDKETKSVSAEKPQDESVEASDASENESEETDGNPPESDDTEDDEETPKEDLKPKKSGFKKRLDKLNKRLAEERAQAEYWRQEALKAKTPQEPQPKETKAEKAPVIGKPKPDDFEYHEDYVDAFTDWKIEQKEKEKEIKAKETQAKTEYQRQVETFQSKVNEVKKVYTDFDDVISEVDDVPLSFGLHDAILTSEMGPEVMYELSKNRAELERINALGAVAAAREIGKIEARITKATESQKEEPKKQTKAPPPISPVSAKGSLKTTKSVEEMSYQEYKKWRESQ